MKITFAESDNEVLSKAYNGWRYHMRRQILRNTASILTGVFLTAGLLYTGIPVSAEDIAESVSTEEGTEITYQTEDYVPSEPTGWFVETPETEQLTQTDGNSGDITNVSQSETAVLQGADLTVEGVYNALMSMQSVYPEGMRWTNDDSYAPYYHYEDGRKIHYTGYGCAAFTFHLSNVAFGDLQDREHYNWDNIKIGDILRINNDTHSVIVIGVSGDDITVAEGNYNSSIHWGRVISRQNLKNGVGTYIWTRWPEGQGTSSAAGITLSSNYLAGLPDSYYTLRAAVSPATADQSVTWSTNNSNIAYIVSTGSGYAMIRLNNPGSCTITCTSKQNSSIVARCDIKVADEAKLEAFVTRLYNKCLSRDPDASGMEHWKSGLASGERSGASVAYGFVFSQEYQNKNTSDDAFVEMLYNVFLDRGSDPSGKQHWMDCLAQGLSREYVFRGFAQSAEYTNICNSYGINRGEVTLSQARDQNVNLTRYVSRLYTQALGRGFDADGLNHWCKTIQQNVKNPQQVAESFINSAEFQNKNLSNEEYVKVLYRTFLGREYDASGLQHWISELNRGCSRQDILSRFANSQEFRNIQASFGL